MREHNSYEIPAQWIYNVYVYWKEKEMQGRFFPSYFNHFLRCLL